MGGRDRGPDGSKMRGGRSRRYRGAVKSPSRRLDLARGQILAFRRRVGALDERLPRAASSLRAAAWAGLADSMPRAALLSIHARVEGTEPTAWEDPSFVQLWGPRFSVYVVPKEDVAVFTLGRLDESGSTGGRPRTSPLAWRPSSLAGSYPTATWAAVWASGTGCDTAHQPAPSSSAGRAPARRRSGRYQHPTSIRTTLDSSSRGATSTCSGRPYPRHLRVGRDRYARGRRSLRRSRRGLTPVRTPIGDQWILTSDEPVFRSKPAPPAPARLLPSGDTYYLLWGSDRELLVPDPGRRGDLWTSRVWPGALLVGGEVVGTWRRAKAKVSIQTWRRSRRRNARAWRRRRHPCHSPASRLGSSSAGTIRVWCDGSERTLGRVRLDAVGVAVDSHGPASVTTSDALVRIAQ